MDLSEYERRQSESQLLLLPSRSATRASTKSPAQSSASTSKNDNGAVCLRKMDANQACRSSCFWISLVEAGVANQLLSQAFHLCRRFLYLLGAFVAALWQKSPIFLEQETGVLLNGSHRRTGLIGKGRR